MTSCYSITPFHTSVGGGTYLSNGYGVMIMVGIASTCSYKHVVSTGRCAKRSF
jgi:hypothetical protein